MSSIIRATTTSGLQIAPDNSGSLQLQTNGTTTAVTIDTSQNVGIGTAIPNSKLHVSSGAATITGASSTTARINMFNNAATTGGLLLGQGYASGTDNTGYIFNVSNAPVVFGTNDTERMRIDSSGNVFVGATSFGSTAHRMLLTTSSDAQLAIQATDTSTGYSTISFANGNTVECQMYYYKANDRFVILNTSAGVYLANAGTSWTSNSDERKKDIIEPITDAANKVSTLRAVIGKYKTDEEGTRRSFLIAQDVQAVLPEAVDAKDPEDLGVQYTDVIPLLVAAIKEQQTIINDLKARIETLEAK